MILVVGGSGRLGRRVCEGLVADGESVRALSRHASVARGQLPSDVDLVDADVRDPEAVADASRHVTTIVLASHGVESRDRDGLTSVDVLGSRAAVAAARREGAAVVLLSTVSAAPDSAMPLARAKWTAEETVRESGVPWTIVRAAAFAQTWTMVLALSAGRSGRPGIIGPGTERHHFVDVRDVAHVVTRAATDDSVRSRVLDVRGPEGLSLTDLAEILQTARGWTGSPRHVPVALMRLVAAAVDPLRPDRARQLRMAALMNLPEVPPDPGAVEVPDWYLPRSITPEGLHATAPPPGG